MANNYNDGFGENNLEDNNVQRKGVNLNKKDSSQANGYNNPQNGYGQMNNGYNNPQNGYGQMNNGYIPPQNGYGQMNNGYGGFQMNNIPTGGYGNGTYNGGNNGEKSNKGLMITIFILVIAIAGLIGFMVVSNSDKDTNNNTDSTSTSENTTEATTQNTTDTVTEASTKQNETPTQKTTQKSTQSSTNKKMVTIPSYVNQELTSAKSSLESMGMTVKTEYKESSAIEKGKVISQDYSEGSSIESGSTVTLTVSSGTMYSPYPYSQKITVKDSDNDHYGTLKLYDWIDGGWSERFSCDATVGKNGIGSNYGEGKSITPKGTFKLGTVLSSYVPVGVSYNYYLVNNSTCIVDDTSSPYYNMVKDISSLPYGTGYDTIGKSIIKNGSSSIIIEHNGNGFSSAGVVRGDGSAITICGISGSLSPTYGCVDISSSNMSVLLSYLDSDKNTHIEIG